ncbi:MAG: energy transducer TonB [Bacteroidales bacterium]|nr:energy transducer TonB [Bacteroidales bacterium]
MKLTPDQKAGLYITAIIHLAVIIVLLAVQIGYEVQRENSFVLDFSAQEEEQREKEQVQLERSTAEMLERLLAQASLAAPVRNVTVDRSALKDDRGTNADELYKEAERLAQELRDGQHRQEEEPDAFASTEAPKQQEAPKQEVKPYTGPSVLSWSLDGRKASHLPIPAYRCYGAGEVTVIITVNNQGAVVNAKVDDKRSTSDACLRNFAVRAARVSKFSASPTAPARQMGTITYAFVAQ